MPDRREFLRLLALGAAGVACTRQRVPEVTAGSPTPTDGATVRAHQLRWRRLDAAGPPARREHTLTGAGDRAYLFGGRDGSEVLGDLWVLERGRDWRRIDASDAPSPRFGHNAEFAGGRLVVFGGQRGGDLFNDVYVLDPESEAWSRLDPSGPTPGIRYGAGSIAWGRHLVISHGFEFGSRYDDTYSFDTRRERWSDRSPSGRRPVKRCLHHCAVVGDHMLLFGGQTDGTPFLGDTWLFDLERASWTESQDGGPSARNLYALASTGEDAYLIGGFGSDGTLDDAWRFDGDDWSRLRPRGTGPSARGGADATVLDGAIIVFGGDDGSKRLDDLYELTIRS
jgi:N-acetylneuraminic acid mutarotase